MSSATVYLVGAGPGAVDLLTVRAANILAQAEIVFHDALVNHALLDYCSPTCEIVAVGTRGGQNAAQRQENILRQLAEASQHYKTIVRLKGGDPGIFGRAGEELAFLTSQGIQWEVVPGISAGIGGLSQLGLPLTHRELSSSVVLLTGSEMSSGDCKTLPLTPPLVGSQTFVVYMAVRHLAAIAQRFMHMGLPASTPALCVSWLTYPHQTLVCAPLAEISPAVAESTIEAPAILVVGDVVGFWTHLRPPGVGTERL